MYDNYFWIRDWIWFTWILNYLNFMLCRIKGEKRSNIIHCGFIFRSQKPAILTVVCRLSAPSGCSLCLLSGTVLALLLSLCIKIDLRMRSYRKGVNLNSAWPQLRTLFQVWPRALQQQPFLTLQSDGYSTSLWYLLGVNERIPSSDSYDKKEEHFTSIHMLLGTEKKVSQ